MLRITLTVTFTLFAGLRAQQAGAFVDDDALVAGIEKAAGELRTAGKLVAVVTLRQQAAQRPQVELQLPAPATERLQPELLYARVRRSTLVVGHFYECKECQQWHFTAATGFAVSKDGVVASCWHLLTDDEEMPKAALVVADYDGHVWPVQEVLAASAVADVCLLRIQATDLEPLPVRAAARTGEHVWCLSNPDHQFGFFSEGMVARKYTSHGPAPGTEPKAGEAAKAGDSRPEAAHAARPATGPASNWLHVTVEFAKGSSGAPVVDACGNVVGIAQSTSTIVFDEDSQPVDTQMVLRTAAAGEALQQLVRAPAAERSK